MHEDSTKGFIDIFKFKKLKKKMINQVFLAPSMQAELARITRDHLLGVKTPLPEHQLAFMNALDDKSIVDMVLFRNDENNVVVEQIRDELEATTAGILSEIFELIDERNKYSLHQRPFQTTFSSVACVAVASVVSSSMISMLGALIGTAGMAATMWIILLPILAPLAAGAYAWLQLSNSLRREVSTAGFDQLDISHHAYNHRIPQFLFEDVIMQDTGKLMALGNHDRVTTEFSKLSTSLDQALVLRNLNVVQLLLEPRFEAVTEGEHGCIRDVDDMSLTRGQIAQLLIQSKQDAP